jgi:hypothetical protein
VGKFAQILNENMDWLKENGHPKWNYVDLEFPLKGWEQYDCVNKYLVKKPKAAPKSSVDINPILKAVKDILK